MFKYLKMNPDFSFSLDGQWKYRSVIQDKVDRLRIPVTGGKFIEKEIEWFILVAHYEMDYLLENYDKNPK